MDPILRRWTSILYGARPRAVSLAGRPLPATPHERYPLVYAKVALADAVALRICATPRIRRLVSVPEVRTVLVCDFRSGSDSDLSAFTDQVCFAPKSGRRETQSQVRFVPAIKRLMRRSKLDGYSITSSARCWRDRGTSSSSAFAVLRLMTNSYVVGNWTGRSAGFAPFKIWSTYVAARRQWSA
jgi:hypothetical protein